MLPLVDLSWKTNDANKLYNNNTHYFCNSVNLRLIGLKHINELLEHTHANDFVIY